MALNQTLRPGLIQLRVLDLDKTLDFYKNILGLDEVNCPHAVASAVLRALLAVLAPVCEVVASSPALPVVGRRLTRLANAAVVLCCDRHSGAI